MNSPFVITNLTSGHTVTWPPFHNIYGNPACYDLLKILFDQIKVDEAVLLLNDDNMVRIKPEVWYSNQGEQYSEWLMSQHNVTGVVCKNKNEAEKLQVELEKRFIWKVLKSGL